MNKYVKLMRDAAESIREGDCSTKSFAIELDMAADELEESLSDCKHDFRSDLMGGYFCWNCGKTL